MDEESGDVERDIAWQNALIVEIAALALEFAERFATIDAEDVAQDVILECLTMLREHRWPAVGSLPAFVNLIVRRRVLNRDRRERRGAKRAEKHGLALHRADHAWMQPLQALERAELIVVCHDVVRQLPRTSALVYSMVREQEMSPREVAVALELSAHTVRAHLRRAEAAIRAELLALGLMPDGSEAPRRMLLDAKAQVPVVRKRRAQTAY